MHPPADPVADEFPNHVETVLLHVMLHQPGDVRPTPARPHVLQRQVQRFPRHIQQLLQRRADLPDAHRRRRVRAIAVQRQRQIQRHIIASFSVRGPGIP